MIRDDARSAIDVLSQVPLFAGLSPAARLEVAAAAQTCAAEAGAILFREGEPARAFFVVKSGSVKLTQLTPEGHQVVLRLLGPGEAFGGVAIYGGAAYPVTAEAVPPVTACEWAGALMADLLTRHPV